jgi:hypothetical protein
MTNIRKRGSQRHCFGAAVVAVCSSDDHGFDRWREQQEWLNGTGSPP